MQGAAAIADVFRAERARVLATTIRVVHGDFELAEEAVQDAFAAALAALAERRHARRAARVAGHGRAPQGDRSDPAARALRELIASDDPSSTPTSRDRARREPARSSDDRLRLIFTCCHPALANEAQVALTLRTLGGLTTEEIARAFLDLAGDDGAAPRAREDQDPRRAHPVRGARAEPARRAHRRRDGGRSTRLQRGLRRDRRRRVAAQAISATKRSGSAACSSS